MKRTLTILGILLSISVPVFSEETFPFLAQSTDESINVRAGQSQGFEKLCQLDKDEEVVVVGKEFSWYKIQLPPKALVYVSDKYVAFVNTSEGVITGDRVNVRSSANASGTILGQLEKGSRIRVIDKRQGWYKIIPPQGIFGWVAETLLTFKSKDISAYQPREEIVKKEQLSGEIAQIPVSAAKVSKGQKAVSVTGILRVPAHPQSANAPYELLIRNKPAYFIQGPKAMLDDFARYTVTVEGTVNPGLDKQFSRPTLSVTRIQLVL